MADPVAQPFLKWPGGKARLFPAIASALGPVKGRYIEPFLGGGAVALGLGIGRAVLADANLPLVETWRAVRDHPLSVAMHLDQLPADHTDHYYDIRDRFRAEIAAGASGPEFAALFIWINKACFNGLYRENASGVFNVPIGRYKRLPLPSRERLLSASGVLKGSLIRHQGFMETLAGAGPNDVVYCDPPYVGAFDKYTAGGFGGQDHLLLAHFATAAARRGAKVLISNSDTPLTRRLYSGLEVVDDPVVKYSIGPMARHRKHKRELLLQA